MKVQTIIKLTSAFILILFVTGCSIHARHGYGYHHSGVHVHGHVHGKPSRVIGALIAGAIIGHAINSMIYRERENDDLPKTPGDQYYLITKDGTCHWVEIDDDGIETRQQVDYQYCEE
ncbi:hypothetical protein [Pleionea sediminis]|uniref:hypothetical protein n=1 Tax=Pleionea sediminis TaxID=2569479 RepID=UPI001186BE9F|nr:hypothetical protein [Pleionea sediminis]